MSEKAKKTTTSKKSSAKKTSSSAKKPAAKTKAKSSTTKKASTAKKPTATAKKTTSKSKTTTKKPATKAKTPTKKPATKTTTTPRKKKLKVLKAKIMGYRRNNRLQTTNQAIAKILDDYNHKALLGKKLIIKFPNSDVEAKATIIAVHGQIKSRLVRIRFNNKGMTAYAINQIAEIQL